jgi:integrase
MPPGSTASSARKLEAELRLALERTPAARQPTIPGDPTMQEILALYVQEAEHLRSPDTAKHHARRIGATCIGRRASEAGAVASEFIGAMRGRYADGTINRSLGTLKRGLQIAWERKLTHANYSDEITRLVENNARETYLSVDQVRTLADACSPAVRTVVWVALLTGCRRREVLSIARSDIGPETVLIRSANTKTLKTRTVPIFPALRPWLEKLPAGVTYEGVKSAFRRARERVGMPGVQFRDLRRSCGMLLLQLETPLDVIRDVLGHSSIKTTEKHYAHAIIGRQRAALEKLGELSEKTG